MLGAPQTRLPGPGGPGWGGGARRALGAGGDRATVRVLAPFPRRGVQSAGVAAAVDPAPGPAGAATPAWAGDPGPESGGVVPGADEVVGGAVDLCPGRGRGADEQCVGADVAANRAVAPGQLRVGQ